MEACSEIHLERFSTREVAYEYDFGSSPLFIIYIFSQQDEVVFWHGIDRTSEQVGQMSFLLVVCADPKSCSLENDADS